MAVMKAPPIRKTSQHNYVQTAVRLPPELRDELRAAAERHGHSLNAEIIARLQTNKSESLAAELAEIKAALRKILDAVT